MLEFTACRLVPLDKGSDSDGNPGVRPIGIGEVLRRIVGKSVMSVLKEDIQESCGCLQTCTGLRSGIEAAIHATTEMWQNSSTEAVLQVDADNAFNRLNRKVALHNIKQLCPSIHTYLLNHYQQAAQLTVSDSDHFKTLLSDEGCTQGDPAAMAFYALGVKPLIDELSKVINKELCQQSWFADDSNALGKLQEIKVWWLKLTDIGPKYGYYPKPSKCILIVKNPTLLHKEHSIFAGTGVQVTCEGQRHLGAVIGSDDYKLKYVSDKVDKWINDIVQLSKIAVEEPQAALSAFTKCICHRWSFIQRTIPGIQHLFAPLEECIRNSFIPALIGKPVSDIERK